jgi:hypothetical protein
VRECNYRCALVWIGTHLGLATRFLLLSDSCRLVDVGHSLWQEEGSVICHSQQ